MKSYSLLFAIVIFCSATAFAQVGIGVEDPAATLDVFGTFKYTDGSHGANKILTSDSLGFASWQQSELTEMANGTSPSECLSATGFVTTRTQPWSVAVSGNFAYVANSLSDTLQIFNISNPTSPNLVGSVQTGDYPGSVAVSGNYAYVVNFLGNTLQIFNVSNPASPSLEGTVATDAYPISVAVSGNFAYVVNRNSSTLQIFNVSNPTVPSLTGSLYTGGQLSSVAVSGNYAYAVDDASNNLLVINISTPSSPIIVVSVGTGSYPSSVAVSGNFAYVVNSLGNALQIFNVTTPSSPTLEGSVATDAYPNSVAVSGNYAYVANIMGNSLQKINVSIPSAPSLVGTLATGSYPNSVAVSVNHAYVVNANTNALQVFQVACPQSNLVFEDGNVVPVIAPWQTNDSAIYNSNPGNVGIGVEDPAATLDVFGTFKFTDGSHGANKILTSDSQGFASWQASELTELATGTSIEECLSATGLVYTNGSTKSVAVSGNYAYVVNANESLMKIYNVSNPSSPILTGSASTLSNPYSVAVDGSYAYVLNYGSQTLQIFNVSDPSSPSLTGSVATGSGNPISVTVSGNYAYVVNFYGNTLQIFNVSNPSSPSLAGSVATGYFPYSVAISGNYAYVVNHYSDNLQVFDVSNPSSPSLAGSVATGSNPISVAVSGNYAYVVNFYGNTIQIFDVSTPSIPSLVGSAGTGEYPYSVAVDGSYAYVVNNGSWTLQIFNVSNPSSPSLAGTLPALNSPESIAISVNFAYVAAYGTLQVFQVACPQSNLVFEDGNVVSVTAPWQTNDSAIYNSNPGKVGIGIEDPAATLDVNGTFKLTDGSQGANKILTSGTDGLASWQDSELSELANESAPSLCFLAAGLVSTGINPHTVAVSGNYAYVVNFISNTLQIFNVSIPSNPSLVGSHSTGSYPVSVAVSGNYAYVVNYISNTLQIFNVSNPSNPSLAGSQSTGLNPISVAVSGNYAYVVNSSSNTMQIFNVSIPSSPILAGYAATGSTPFSVAVSGNYAYVSNYASNTLQIFNVSTPSNPSLTGSVTTGNSPRSVAVSGNYAYVVNSTRNTMQIFNTSIPSSPILAGSAATGSNPYSVAVSGNYALVTNANGNTLQIFNVNTPSSPSLAGSLPTGTYPSSVAISGNYAYVLNYSSNTLQSFQVFCSQSLTFEGGNFILEADPWQTNNTSIYNLNQGNVGIGTSAPGAKLDVAGGNIRTNQQLVSTQANGTAPLSVTSSTQVTNLNADLLDGFHASNFIQNQSAVNQAAGFRIGGNGIFNGGKLGIGTSNPTGDLHIQKLGDALFVLEADSINNSSGEDNNPRLELLQDGELVTCVLGIIGTSGTIYNNSIQNSLYLMNEYPAALHIGTDSTIRMTILADGKVGIGANDPTQLLDVAGNARFRSVGSGSYLFPLNMTVNGTLTTASSDIRLKTNIENLEHCLDRVMQLRGVRYNWKDDTDGAKKIGFIAQEVEPLFPEIVFTNPSDGFKGINYAEMTSVLVVAIKELSAEKDKQINSLNTQNEELIKIV